LKCPNCGSTQISKERWKDVVDDGYGLAGDSIYSETGDYVCGECKYTSSADSFKEKIKS